MAFLRVLSCLCIITFTVIRCQHFVEGRSFVSLGCMGMHDKSKFSRLASVCDECYELFREPDIAGRCRANCFNNNYFSGCVKALLLTDEKDELFNSVQQLYGKRK